MITDVLKRRTAGALSQNIRMFSYVFKATTEIKAAPNNYLQFILLCFTLKNSDIMVTQNHIQSF